MLNKTRCIPLIKAQWVHSIGGKRYCKQAKGWKAAPDSYYWVESPNESQSVDYVGCVFMVALSPLIPPPSNPFSQWSIKLPRLHLMFGCETLLLLPSVARRTFFGLSDNSLVRLEMQNSLQAGHNVSYRFCDRMLNISLSISQPFLFPLLSILYLDLYLIFNRIIMFVYV